MNRFYLLRFLTPNLNESFGRLRFVCVLNTADSITMTTMMTKYQQVDSDVTKVQIDGPVLFSCTATLVQLVRVKKSIFVSF